MKAIIFDMDGVLVNSEPVWEKAEASLLPQLFGQEIYEAVYPHILGNSIHVIYEKARDMGAMIDQPTFLARYDACAREVYREADLEPSFPTVFRQLKIAGCAVGVASNSPPSWMGYFLARLPSDIRFDAALSISGRERLRPKPAPDLYEEIMNNIKAQPAETLIVEDTQKGVEAAKASGAFTVCLTKYLILPPPKGADAYVDTLDSIPSLITP